MLRLIRLRFVDSLDFRWTAMYIHTQWTVFILSADWRKIRLAPDLPERNCWRKSGRDCTILGGISGRRLSRQLSEDGAISGVDCTHIYVCRYVWMCMYVVCVCVCVCVYTQSTLTAVRQVERRMTKFLCCQTRRMLTPLHIQYNQCHCLHGSISCYYITARLP